MTYLPAGSIVDWAQEQIGTKSVEQTTQQSVDPIRIWGGLAVNLRNKEGSYGPMTLRGMSIPRVTLTQIREIAAAWISIGDKAIATGMSGRSDVKQRAINDRYRFSQDIAKLVENFSAVDSLVRITALYTDGGKYVWYPTAASFYDAVSRYVIGLSGTLWAVVNIQSDFERWISVMPWGTQTLFKAGWYTAKDVTPAIKAAVDVAVSAVKGGFTILKYLPYAVVVVFGYFAFRQIQKGI
ncbi:MAG: hypothetical protein Q8S00_32650 [Deltaproteobacteria bacterium]|nr:hypothetical protein [Deltaproteobacteria bacterium]